MCIYIYIAINNIESRELLKNYKMPYYRDSFVPEEGNLMDMILPSSLRKKRSRAESEKNEYQTKKRSMTEIEEDNFRYDIINNSYDIKREHSPVSTSTSSPQSSILHHLLSQHMPIQRCNPAYSSLNFPKIELFSSSPILSPPQSTSPNFSVEFEPTHLAPAMSLPTEHSLTQISSNITINLDTDGNKNCQKSISGNGLSLCLGTSSKISSSIRPGRLSRQSTFKSTASSDVYQSEAAEPYSSSLTNTLSLEFEPVRKSTFRSTIDSVRNLLRSKSESIEREELDTQLSLGSSSSSSKAALDLWTPPSILKLPMRDSESSISRLEFPQSQIITPEINTTLSISKLGIPQSQLITPSITKLGIPQSHSPERKSTPLNSKLGISRRQSTFEQKIDLLKQQTVTTMDAIDGDRREALAQARIESLRREKLLKRHLKRNKVSSTKAEDLLSQSLRMGRFSVQYAEKEEFMEKRSIESSWRKKQIKEKTPKTSFEKEIELSENLRTRNLSSRSSKKEIPTNDSFWSKYLLTLGKHNHIEAGSITSQEDKLAPFPSETMRSEFKSGMKGKEKVKELLHIRSISEELGRSLQWSRSKIKKNKGSLGEIDLSLGLQTPSTSSQIAENPRTTAPASFRHK